jgi:hypothetical protein
MVQVQEMYIYWYDIREVKYVPGQKPELGERKKIVVKPSGPEPIQLKTDVARALKKIIKRVHKYYVVAQVEKSDGGVGYRTLTKTIEVQ